MTARDLGLAFCISAIDACALLHVATFLTVVPGLLILIPFFLMMGAILCSRATQGWNLSSYRRMSVPTPTGQTAIVGWVLLAYAVFLFVHFYRSSGGATSVGIVGGQFVYLNKGAVIRPISEQEYRMFPTQWDRVMSAWIGMMATFCLSSFINQEIDRLAQTDRKQVP